MPTMASTPVILATRTTTTNKGSTMEHPTVPTVNPYARNQTQNEAMGPQSQRRLTLQDRTHLLQADSHKKKKRKIGPQLTLNGDRAFEPNRDCKVCKGKLAGREVHRAHHKLCPNNRRTKGVASAVTIQQNKIDKALKNHFAKPLSTAEKGSWKYSTKDAGERFFAERNLKEKPSTAHDSKPMEKAMAAMMDDGLGAAFFCKEVITMVNDATFC